MTTRRTAPVRILYRLLPLLALLCVAVTPARGKGGSYCVRHFYNNSFYTFSVASLAIGHPGFVTVVTIPPHSAAELNYMLNGVPDDGLYLVITSNIPAKGADDTSKINRFSIKKEHLGFSDCPYINHGTGYDPNRPLQSSVSFNEPANGDITTCDGICSPDVVSLADANKFLFPTCAPIPPTSDDGSVLYAVGRDNLLYRKDKGLNAPWSVVHGYNSTHTIVSIAAMTDGTLVGLETGGKLYRLPAPYEGDWRLSPMSATTGLKSICLAPDGRLIGMLPRGLGRMSDQNPPTWIQIGTATSEFWPFIGAAIMPNGRYLLSNPAHPLDAKKNTAPAPGTFAEYRIVDMQFIPIRAPDPLYYPKSLTQQLFTEQPDAFAYLPSGTLVFATEIGEARLISWYVNNCGSGIQTVLSNAGAPPLKNQDINPHTPQWRSFAVVAK